MTIAEWTADFFAPRAEPASLFGNDVAHLPEQLLRLPTTKIDLAAIARVRRAAKRAHAEWFTQTFGEQP